MADRFSESRTEWCPVADSCGSNLQAQDSQAGVVCLELQAEALEELMGLEDPQDLRTTVPRLLWEHRKLEKLLNGFVAVHATPGTI